MKYFYLSLFLSITFLVIGFAASVEQKHSEAKAQAELIESENSQLDEDQEDEKTFGQICLSAIAAFFKGMAVVIIIFFLYALSVVVFTKFFELLL